MDTGTFLTHLVQSGWVKKLQTSMLVFNIAQFFPSLNHQLLPIILDKVGFDPKFLFFFSNYLIGRKTQYLWNSFISPFFCIDVGVGQDSTLYLSLVFYIFEKRTKNLKIPVLFLSFVDDRLFISQGKSFKKMNSHLFHSYNIISSLLEQFGLVIEHRKSEIFHFARLHSLFNPLSLDLSHFRGSILKPKDTWKYLGFIFNKKLSF